MGSKSICVSVIVLMLFGAQSQASIPLDDLGLSFMEGEVFEQDSQAYDEATRSYPLLHVTSDTEPGYLDIRVEVDSEARLVSLWHFSNGVQLKPISLEDLEKGVVLLKSGKYEVVKLVGSQIDPERGGTIKMIYLSNGLLNSYDVFSMDIVPADTESHWALQVVERGRPRYFTKMFLEGRRFLGKLIGISLVTVS